MDAAVATGGYDQPPLGASTPSVCAGVYAAMVRAKRKLETIHAAARLDDLRVPPSNRLEKLKGSSEPLYSTRINDQCRINDQWRVVFRWLDGDAYDVAIVEYH